jgi:hypothetical protein
MASRLWSNGLLREAVFVCPGGLQSTGRVVSRRPALALEKAEVGGFGVGEEAGADQEADAFGGFY